MTILGKGAGRDAQTFKFSDSHKGVHEGEDRFGKLQIDRCPAPVEMGHLYIKQSAPD